MAKKIPLLCVLWIVAIVATSATDSSGGADSTTQSTGTDSTTRSTGTDATTQSTGTDATTRSTGTDATTLNSASTNSNPVSSLTATSPSSVSTASPSTGTVPATPETPNPCESSPCGAGSTCENRANQSFVCLCLLGDTYNNVAQSCEKAKVFPGHLTLQKQYDAGMADKTTEIFLTTSKEIAAAIDDGFKTIAGYSGSAVLELRPSGASIARLVRNDAVEASVEILFKADADVTEDTVKNVITSAGECDGCLLSGSSFDYRDLCESNACHLDTMSCTPSSGSFSCSCKEGYFPTDFSSRVCVACPPGEKFDGSKCVSCPFGYSGFNCQEDWKLILVIVGSVLGAMLLIAIILLSLGATKSRKSSKKNKNVDIGKPYVSHYAPKAPLVNGSNDHVAPGNRSASSRIANAGVPQIPRATTNSSWDRRTNLEMTPSNSRQNLINGGRNMRLNDDQDDVFSYGQARPQGNPYATNNPYAQNRASINPYAQREGHSNPYYLSDDGSRYN